MKLKRLLSACAVLVGIVGVTNAALPNVASAHTPQVRATCSGLEVRLNAYDGPPTNNQVTVTIDGQVVDQQLFGTSFGTTTYPWAEHTDHTYEVFIDANRVSGNPTQYDRTVSGSSQACNPCVDGAPEHPSCDLCTDGDNSTGNDAECDPCDEIGPEDPACDLCTDGDNSADNDADCDPCDEIGPKGDGCEATTTTTTTTPPTSTAPTTTAVTTTTVAATTTTTSTSVASAGPTTTVVDPTTTTSTTVAQLAPPGPTSTTPRADPTTTSPGSAPVLPATGAGTGRVVAIATSLLGAGVAVVAVTRRRRPDMI